MKIRRGLWVFLPALVTLVLAVYFEPSHCVRGWLRGEAFYEGRPTSWWRGRIDSWIEECGSRSHALQSLGNHGDIVWPNMRGDVAFRPIDWAGLFPEPTIWERVRGWLIRPVQFDGVLEPKILHGLPEAESVLRELEGDAWYRAFVEQARRNAEIRR